ncbi:MAG: hypothetical protein A2284_09480 [Deltaproteobacteria bacterium RIFOXYA12_FULL_61_11]|nr:MAG: hypothetical protein A2284_09480 [Deltaproteobacteria bacterium RIFOXYA12_FULL_61_11]
MSNPIVFLYPGQGAQYHHMGGELRSGHPVFAASIAHSSELCSAYLSPSLLEVLYDPAKRKHHPFDDLRYSHPALLAFELALSDTLLAEGIRPALFLGYSLGEFVAMTSSGVLSREQAFTLVCSQAKAVLETTRASSMLAILSEESLFHHRDDLFKETWLAAVNSPGHFVVSGFPEVLAQLHVRLQAEGITSLILPVSRGFHSALVDPLRTRFFDLVTGIPLNASGLSHVSCALQRRLSPADFGPELFWAILRRPVQFQRTLQWLETSGPYTYIDLGPSGTLANFARQILPATSASTVHHLVTGFGREIESLRDFLEQRSHS